VANASCFQYLGAIASLPLLPGSHFRNI